MADQRRRRPTIIHIGSKTHSVQTIRRSFPEKGIPKVAVRNENGGVRIGSQDDGEVIVEAAVMVAGAKDQQEADDAGKVASVEIAKEGPLIRVVASVPRSSREKSPEVFIELDIRVPRRSDVDIRVERGDVRSENVAGTLNLDTRNGDLAVAACAGMVSATVSEGDVRLDDVEGGVRVDAIDGDVFAAGKLTYVQIETREGSVDARIEQGSEMQADWSIHAREGDARLDLPAQFSARLRLEAIEGEIRVAPALGLEGSVSGEGITGEIGGGGNELRVQSDQGSIHVTTTVRP